MDDLYRSKSSIARMELTVTTPRNVRTLRIQAWTRGEDDALWTRFRGLQDTFFEARTAAQSAVDGEQAEKGGTDEGFSIPAQREATRRKAVELLDAILERRITESSETPSMCENGGSAVFPYMRAVPSAYTARRLWAMAA